MELKKQKKFTTQNITSWHVERIEDTFRKKTFRRTHCHLVLKYWILLILLLFIHLTFFFSWLDIFSLQQESARCLLFLCALISTCPYQRPNFFLITEFKLFSLNNFSSPFHLHFLFFFFLISEKLSHQSSF